MPRPQLNLRLAPELLELLERTAAATGSTVAALCRGWILAGLDGGLAASGAASGDGLAERLAAVEARLAALEAARPSAPTADPEPPPSATEEPLEATHEGSVFTVAELAAITGTNPKGWVNWAQSKEPGAVRHHTSAGSWQLLGKRPDPRGGPSRLVFRRVAPPQGEQLAL